MSTILQKIVASKRQEIAQAKGRTPESELRKRVLDLPPALDFAAPLRAGGAVKLIAEVKRGSPSAGTLREPFDPVTIASAFAAAGASAISVLTDAPFFQGSLDHLAQIRQAVSLPLLRKDFILEEYQVLEARLHGADAVLLIAEILPGGELAALLQQVRALGLQALVELYEAENLERVLRAGANMVGINNRDLRTFRTDLSHTIRLAAHVPRDCILVSESGIGCRSDVEKLEQAGAHAMLVGETLMRASDIGQKIQELLGR